MANLLSSLLSSANALNTFDQALAVTQNNVANASTPGYAKQSLSLESMPFDLISGSLGGVRAGQVMSARYEYAEQAVRRQTASTGYDQQSVNSLQSLQSLLDVTGNSGISAALNNLYQSFAAWGQSPSDTTSRQSVIDSAGSLATAFQQTAEGLANLEQDTNQNLQQTVDQVNQLVGQLQKVNAARMAGAQNDAGLDAQMHSLLEQLSQYVSVNASFQQDGSVTVLLNGQTPLLIGNSQYQLGFALAMPTNPPPTNAQAPPQAEILASDGTDVTSATTGGQLGSLLNLRNTVLPSYLGDSYQAGDLNTMAKQFADRVNQVLTGGLAPDGVTQGKGLFLYDSTNATNVAASISVDSTVTPDQLGAIDPGPPSVADGIPLALSNLASPQAAADKINGESYSSFYGSLAARAGTALNNAQGDLSSSQASLTQTKQLRQQTSGVSLDEEATSLIQFQRAYEANSRLISVLDQLTADTINILQPGGAA
jgi:flagellar hook-associated protein 1 FlgK